MKKKKRKKSLVDLTYSYPQQRGNCFGARLKNYSEDIPIIFTERK